MLYKNICKEDEPYEKDTQRSYCDSDDRNDAGRLRRRSRQLKAAIRRQPTVFAVSTMSLSLSSG